MSSDQSKLCDSVGKTPDVVRAYNQLAEFALFVPEEGWIANGKVAYKSSEEYAIEHGLYCSAPKNSIQESNE